MKTILIILMVLTGILLFSTTVCGLWMHGQDVVEPGSITFHVTIALATVAVTVLTLGLAFWQALAVA